VGLFDAQDEPALQHRPFRQFEAPGQSNEHALEQQRMSAVQEFAPTHSTLPLPPVVLTVPRQAPAPSQWTVQLFAPPQLMFVHALAVMQKILHATPAGQTVPVQVLQSISHVSPLHVPPASGQTSTQLASTVAAASASPASAGASATFASDPSGPLGVSRSPEASGASASSRDC
jgi:hypothetical protein